MSALAFRVHPLRAGLLRQRADRSRDNTRDLSHHRAAGRGLLHCRPFPFLPSLIIKFCSLLSSYLGLNHPVGNFPRLDTSDGDIRDCNRHAKLR
jgi:hypothetical protein